MASKETLSVLKKTLVELTRGRIVLPIWMFVAKLTHELFLRLDILRVYKADLKETQAVNGSIRDVVIASWNLTTALLLDAGH
jgi:hypothetical protein